MVHGVEIAGMIYRWLDHCALYRARSIPVAPQNGYESVAPAKLIGMTHLRTLTNGDTVWQC